MREALVATACLWGALATAHTADPSALEEAQRLVGLEYRLGPGAAAGQIIAQRPSCSNVGGSVVWNDGRPMDEWSFGEFICNGRSIALLKRQVGEASNGPTWRIVDALPLPSYEQHGEPKRPNALRLYFNGECELDGKTDTLFFALVRFGKRDRIDWRTGVERAWGFNLTAERIVPLSTKRIVCYRPEPA
ncbi:hypothetical protein M8A51_00070 [Schlegelella sp. S2-27]|uniref:DUF1036 domain-containing protein n=1 Tax=Caldimonas mangrovi TaxID=2944811 RepID=A0ABT0YGR5_9BURK|nr:hypothetical protein [Caldimonas mangrovi]MCM5677925.1 hypothetical protein [Caldimonas mangrovi]